MERDLEWDAMVTAAERLNHKAQSDERPEPRERLQVTARRKRSLVQFTVTEGFDFGNLWTVGFEPVRYRRLFTRNWREEQPMADAARKVSEFVSQRPDSGFNAGA